MDLNSILAFIGSGLSLLISGGSLVALLQIRATNTKLLAEAELKKAEAEKARSESDKIKTEANTSAFQAQISAANQLTTNFTSRLDVLTNRLDECEKEADCREARIKILEDEKKDFILKIERQSDTLKMMNADIQRLLKLITEYLEVRKTFDSSLTESMADVKLEEDIKLFISNFERITKDLEK